VGCLLAGAALGTVLTVLTVLAPAPLQARPERVRPGIAYYSDEIVVREGVADLGPERNYEEVYRYYEYYEARYDAAGRVVLCIAYRQGRELWREAYTYGPDGRPLRKEVTDAQGRAHSEALR
jgi:hypothetical protein